VCCGIEQKTSTLLGTTGRFGTAGWIGPAVLAAHWLLRADGTVLFSRRKL
jgi:hypothetical protein